MGLPGSASVKPVSSTGRSGRLGCSSSHFQYSAPLIHLPPQLSHLKAGRSDSKSIGISSDDLHTGQFILFPLGYLVIHDPRDVRGDLWMKLQAHQPRRPWIWESNSAREIAWEGSASISASRRSASATPSSSSDKMPGRESRRFAASVARCRSGKSSASFSNSTMVLMNEG